MSPERLSEVRDLLFKVERRLKPLEWDASRNQINEFKKLEMQRLQGEHRTLLQELKDLETVAVH
ncbi:hypothetical protein HYU22_04560 [Candidatus Woesearchaeota archaeon]|nr:hypothetical protein [Candidatus Woesearchaeota archaeon]